MSQAWIQRPTPLLLMLTGGMAAFAAGAEIQALQGPIHFPTEHGKRMLVAQLTAFTLSLGPSLGVFFFAALGPALRGPKGHLIRFALLPAGALLGSIPLHAFWVHLGQRAWASPYWLVDVGFLLVTNIALVWLSTKDASARAAASEGKALLQQTIERLDSAHQMSLQAPSQRYAEILDHLEADIEPVLDALIADVDALKHAPASTLAERLPDLLARLDLLREEEVRRLSHQLHPSVIDVGMIPAFHFLADRLLPDLALTLDFPCATTHDPPAETRLVLYRCAEEALSSARRHPAATHATLRWEERPDGWFLRVSPLPGADPNSEAPAPSLRILESRVQLTGGSWSLERMAGTATSLEVFIPRSAPLSRPSGGETARS